MAVWACEGLWGSGESAVVARRDPRIAVRFGDWALSHGELERRASRLAGGLLEAGIAPGDRVALFMPCPELVIAYLA